MKTLLVNFFFCIADETDKKLYNYKMIDQLNWAYLNHAWEKDNT